MTRICVAALLVSVCWALAAASELKRVCYFTNWAQYRPGDGRYLAEDVDASLCSHVIFAFAKLQSNSIVHTEWNDLSDQWRKGAYEQLNDLKISQPKLKTLLSVGGWNMQIASMTAMLATEESRGQFVASAIQFLRMYQFDGLDLVFQYPGNRGSPPEDKQRFTLLLQELRAEFEEEATSSGRPELLLSAAVPAGRYLADSAYEMGKIGDHVDFLSLMTYDFTNGWEGVTGHPAPLFAPANDLSFNNIADSVSYWLERGAPAEKLVLGLPLHGRGFTLSDPEKAGYGDLTVGPSKAQTYTREPGIMSHYEMCSKLNDGVRVWNDDTKVPHVVVGNQWIGYDDEESLAGKVAWLKEQGLGGWMAWSLDNDDFLGTFCQQGANPLLQALNEASHESELTPKSTTTTRAPTTTRRLTTTQGPTTISRAVTTNAPVSTPRHTNGPTSSRPDVTTTSRPQTTTKGGDFDVGAFCAGRGEELHTYPGDPSRYIHCSNGQGWVKNCAIGTHFSEATKSCSVVVAPTTPGGGSATTPRQNQSTSGGGLTTSSPTQDTTTMFDEHDHLCDGLSDGLYPYPGDDRFFVQCFANMGFLQKCAAGALYNPDTEICDILA